MMERTVNIPDGGTLYKVLVWSKDKDGAVAGTAPADGQVSELPSEFAVGQDAHLDIVIVILPGVSKDVELTVRLDGTGAEAHISGLYILPEQERVNIHLTVMHNFPSCVSRQLFKGIVGGTAASAFTGLIRVAPHAQKTEAYQENHNILLSDEAQASAKPQLEIYADDVKCSHGATTGSLNEEEQFYMRSRGISEAEAKVLQMFSFLSPVLAHIEAQDERDRVGSLVVSALNSFTSL